MPFYKFGCSYVMLYNIQNAWCLFCLFCDYWFEIINYITCNIYIHMCYKFLACESKMASIFSGQFSGLPTELPTISILESSGLPTELHTELPTISIYGSSGQPYLHGKIPMGSPLCCPLSCPLFSYMEVVGSLLSWPLNCPLFRYMEVVGSLIYMAKFPWAAHGQRSGQLPCFFCMGYVVIMSWWVVLVLYYVVE